VSRRALRALLCGALAAGAAGGALAEGGIDDPGYTESTAFDAMGWRAAWDAGWRGKGVKVAYWNPLLIQSGVRCDHPEVRPALWVNAAEDHDGDGRLSSGDLNEVDDDGNGCVDDVHGCNFSRLGAGANVCTPVGSSAETALVATIAARVDGRGQVGWAPESEVVLIVGLPRSPETFDHVFEYLSRVGVRVLISPENARFNAKTLQECAAIGRSAHPEWRKRMFGPGAPLWVFGLPNQWPACAPTALSVVGIDAKDAIVPEASVSVPNRFVDVAVRGEIRGRASLAAALAAAGGILAVMTQRYPEASREEMLVRLCQTATRVGERPYDQRHPHISAASWNPWLGCGRVHLGRAVGVQNGR
jgi:hypothetical protein